MTMTMHGDRGEVTPFGLAGGTNGGRNILRVHRKGDTEETELGMHAMGITLYPGDHVIYRSNGGGGFGSPLTRDPELVLADVESGWLTFEKAKEVYGVVIATDERHGKLRIDHNGTAATRASLARRPVRKGYDFGEVHPSGEKIDIETETMVA